MAFTRSGVRSPSPPWPAGPSARAGRPRVTRLRRLCRSTKILTAHAGIAQLVEHNLAKVGVAGSSPVSRSAGSQDNTSRGGAVWYLAGLITRRSWVQIPPPLLTRRSDAGRTGMRLHPALPLFSRRD